MLNSSSNQQVHWPISAWYRWQRAVRLARATEWADVSAVMGLLSEVDDDERLARRIIALARVSDSVDLLGVLDEVRRLGVARH